MRYSYMLLSAIALVLLVACSDDDESTAPQTQEFVAEQADFAGYRSWQQTVSPRVGPDPGGVIGGAHSAEDSTITRYIFVKDEGMTRGSDGQFPVGAIFAKEMRNEDGSVAVVTVMAKRGGSFNASNNGWEWFILNGDGEIQQRGADVFGGACNSCHAAAANEDYVFTK